MNRTDVLWVYQRSEPNLYTVGYYDPSHNWHADSDYGNVLDAADRVHFLNGGNLAGAAETNRYLADIADSLRKIAHSMEIVVSIESVPPKGKRS